MAKPTRTQIDFAKMMTIRQRGVLNSLVMFDCAMSANELADEELKDIVQHQLARYIVHPDIDGASLVGSNGQRAYHLAHDPAGETLGQCVGRPRTPPPYGTSAPLNSASLRLWRLG